MEESPKETVYDIEKMAELQKIKRETTNDITFDNRGNIVYNNRAFVRNAKRLWRAVMEQHKSCRYYTQPSGLEKPKTNKASKKRERQNRRIGRMHNGNS